MVLNNCHLENDLSKKILIRAVISKSQATVVLMVAKFNQTHIFNSDVLIKGGGGAYHVFFG